MLISKPGPDVQTLVSLPVVKTTYLNQILNEGKENKKTNCYLEQPKGIHS